MLHCVLVMLLISGLGHHTQAECGMRNYKSKNRTQALELPAESMNTGETCTYTFSSGFEKFVGLTFTELNVGTAAAICNSTFVEVLEIEHAEEFPIARYCGSLKQIRIKSTTSIVMLRIRVADFDGSTVPERSVHLNVQEVDKPDLTCGQRQMTLSNTQSEHKFPATKMSVGRICEYIFIGGIGTPPRLMVDRGKIGESADICTAPYWEIYEELNQQNWLKKQVCGVFSPQYTHAEEPRMRMILFSSSLPGSFISSKAISVRADASENFAGQCGPREINVNTEQTIEIPTIELSYGDICTYRFTAPKEMHIQLTITSVGTATAVCAAPYVEIKDVGTTNLMDLARICGTNPVVDMTFPSNSLEVTIKSAHSDLTSVEGNSVSIVHKAISEIADGCGNHHIEIGQSAASDFQLPNATMSRGRICAYEITAAQGFNINMSFTKIPDIMRSCESAFLRVMGVRDGVLTDLTAMCQEEENVSVISESNRAKILLGVGSADDSEITAQTVNVNFQTVRRKIPTILSTTTTETVSTSELPSATGNKRKMNCGKLKYIVKYNTTESFKFPPQRMSENSLCEYEFTFDKKVKNITVNVTAFQVGIANSSCNIPRVSFKNFIEGKAVKVKEVCGTMQPFTFPMSGEKYYATIEGDSTVDKDAVQFSITSAMLVKSCRLKLIAALLTFVYHVTG